MTDADGIAIAWTTDVIVAQVICGLMNEYTNNERIHQQRERKIFKMTLQMNRDDEAIDMARLIIDEAMKLFPEPDLELLRMALCEASTLVCDYIDDLPEVAEDLGLDKWIAAEKAKNHTVPLSVED